jgi:transcription antitermination factor NusG
MNAFGRKQQSKIVNRKSKIRIIVNHKSKISMKYSDTDILWYVLFAANGKAAKLKPYLEAASIEYFFPMYQKDRKINGKEEYERISLPLLGNLIFVKSSRSVLDPVLKEAKLKLSISSDLYYRNFGDRITVAEDKMRNFIIVAKNIEEQVIYLSNDEIDFKKGIKVKITGGAFAGAEGVQMRVKGDKRLVVCIPNFFAVATTYIPSQFIQLMI